MRIVLSWSVVLVSLALFQLQTPALSQKTLQVSPLQPELSTPTQRSTLPPTQVSSVSNSGIEDGDKQNNIEQKAVFQDPAGSAISPAPAFQNQTDSATNSSPGSLHKTRTIVPSNPYTGVNSSSTPFAPEGELRRSKPAPLDPVFCMTEYLGSPLVGVPDSDSAVSA